VKSPGSEGGLDLVDGALPLVLSQRHADVHLLHAEPAGGLAAQHPGVEPRHLADAEHRPSVDVRRYEGRRRIIGTAQLVASQFSRGRSTKASKSASAVNRIA
jgi:hypothetical protein